jgi:GAF domain-containing protein
MIPAPTPQGEEARLEALRQYRILDTAPEKVYDDIVALASRLCEVPTAVISLLDRDRQWFKARVGLDVAETPRDISFCGHVIAGKDTMVVEDALKDARFSDNPLVMDAPGIRFYAGAPLVNPEGHALGTLCVIDRRPRQITSEQRVALESLTRIVSHLIESRRIADHLADTLARLKVLQGLLPVCSYCRRVRDDGGYWQSVEQYLEEHADTMVSHGICSDCMQQHFPQYLKD